MVIFAGTKGYLDKIPRNQVSAWEAQFLTFMREQRPAVRNTLIKERKLTKETEDALRAAIDAFQPQYQAPGAAAPAAAKKETNVKEGAPPQRPAS
jgi:F-type H+-transporting ATPase subunit alpha